MQKMHPRDAHKSNRRNNSNYKRLQMQTTLPPRLSPKSVGANLGQLTFFILPFVENLLFPANPHLPTTADMGHPPPFNRLIPFLRYFFGIKRSMNLVSKFPVTKSGSCKMRLWSGIEV